MMALLRKDFDNARSSIGPAIMLGVPILLIIQFAQDADAPKLQWKTAFWLAYFFATTSLFFRSFGLENRSKNFHIYSAFKISRLQIFFSQALVQWASASLLGVIYLGLSFVFWSPEDFNWKILEIVLLASACLAPLGTLLGLILQLEREFLFSVIYLPLSSPVVLGAYSLSAAEFSTTWLYVLLSFCLVSGFLGALIFEFFFDELSQSL